MSLFLVLLTVFAVGIETKSVCRLPNAWKTKYDFDYHLRQGEWVSLKKKTDFYKLVLSWSPTFCKHLPARQRNSTFQCKYEDFDLVVHGLWAQSRSASSLRDHPRNCRNDKMLPLNTIKRYFCMIPDEFLIQSEWEKHGTCAFRSADDYLKTIESLVSKLKIPEMKKLLGNGEADAMTIKNAFLQNNPKLRSNQISIYTKDKELIDINKKAKKNFRMKLFSFLLLV